MDLELGGLEKLVGFELAEDGRCPFELLLVPPEHL